MNRALIFLKNSIPRFSAEVQNPVIHQLPNWECGATLHGEFLMEIKRKMQNYDQRYSSWNLEVEFDFLKWPRWVGWDILGAEQGTGRI